eukprot:GHRR01024503.1.p1 GENE.GHRR01024503.1~~GHRR01024503.1.p1  ORF type:complete len:288 (+),score=78.80 GHRR01024503.1:137-1000(+)
MPCLPVNMGLGHVCCLGVLASHLVLASSHPTAITTPLIAWGNERYLTADQGSTVSYKVHNGLYENLGRMINSAVGRSTGETHEWLNTQMLQQHAPEVVLVVLGSQLKSSDFHGKAKQGLLWPLKLAVDAAKSSVAAPYMLQEALTRDSQQLLVQQLAITTQAQVIGCGGHLESAVLSATLQQLGEEPTVLMVCTSIAAESTGTPEGLAVELQQLQDAHAAVAALGKRQITVYAVQPHAASTQQRRVLQASNADVGICGPLCQTQVKWLEGILAAFILVFAALAGKGA